MIHRRVYPILKVERQSRAGMFNWKVHPKTKRAKLWVQEENGNKPTKNRRLNTQTRRETPQKKHRPPKKTKGNSADARESISSKSSLAS